MGLCILEEEILSYDFEIWDLHTSHPASKEGYTVVDHQRWMYGRLGTAVKWIKHLVIAQCWDQQTQHYEQLTHIINIEIYTHHSRFFPLCPIYSTPTKKLCLNTYSTLILSFGFILSIFSRKSLPYCGIDSMWIPSPENFG